MAGMGTLRWRVKELWFNLRQREERSVCSKSPRPALGLAHSPVWVSGFLFQRVNQPESEAHIFQVPVIRMNRAAPLGSVCPRGVSREN
jgi:hypothetical protein